MGELLVGAGVGPDGFEAELVAILEPTSWWTSDRSELRGGFEASVVSFRMRQNFLILVADDDENDRTLIRLAISRNTIPVEIREVHDGAEVVAYLQGEGKYSDREKYPFPEMLLVDLKMPRMDGLGVLQWLEAHPECAFLPVVMLSGSGAEKDILEAYRRGVKAYFVKPSDLNELTEIVRLVAGHWAKAERPEMPERCK